MANKKSNITAEHPKFNVMDNSQARMTLVDIGHERKAEKDGTVHNRGFGDWDGQIIHFQTRDDKEYILIQRPSEWTEDEITKTMDAYVNTFRTLNTKGKLISYDFDDVNVKEIIAWPPVPSGQIDLPEELVEGE